MSVNDSNPVVFGIVSGGGYLIEGRWTMKLQSVLLLVEHLDRATGFYRGLGLEVEGEHDVDEGAVFLDAGGAQIWLYRADGVDKAGHPMCILAVEDLDAAHQAVEDHGGRVISKARSDPFGTYQLVLDTEGNMLEIRRPPSAP